MFCPMMILLSDMNMLDCLMIGSVIWYLRLDDIQKSNGLITYYLGKIELRRPFFQVVCQNCLLAL